MRLTAYSILLLIFIACNEKAEQARTQADTVVKAVASDTGKYISQTRLEEFIRQTPGIAVDNSKPKPFDSLQFDKVIAYDYDGSDHDSPAFIDSTGKFVSTIKEQQALNADQVNAITSCLGSKQSYGAGTAPCFRPGMAIVFFQNNRAVMTTEICLDCNFLESSVRIPGKYGKKTRVDGTEVELVGFSKEGRQCIIGLAKQLSFSYASEKIEY